MATKPRRLRTMIEWNPTQDQAIMADVLRFRARAIGARLRELIIMGQEAERMGMRARVRGGVLVAEMPPGWLLSPADAVAQPEPVQDETLPETVKLTLTAEHQRGLETLFAALDFGSDDHQ